ncbi:MAG: hypothetical protein QOJ40_2296, partial [Verrucomicrobiota bacterium]
MKSLRGLSKFCQRLAGSPARAFLFNRFSTSSKHEKTKILQYQPATVYPKRQR